MSVSWSPNCSFRGVAFSTEQSGGPGWKEEIDRLYHFSITDIPGGDNAYLQIGGRQSARWQRQIVVPAANWSSLKSQEKQQGTLNLHGISYTATLVGLSGIRYRQGDLVVCAGLWVV